MSRWDPLAIRIRVRIPGSGYERNICGSRTLHCKENPIYVFLFWELRSLGPNFHIHVSARLDLV
jgi:hypothetical protein